MLRVLRQIRPTTTRCYPHGKPVLHIIKNKTVLLATLSCKITDFALGQLHAFSIERTHSGPRELSRQVVHCRAKSEGPTLRGDGQAVFNRSASDAVGWCRLATALLHLLLISGSK